MLARIPLPLRIAGIILVGVLMFGLVGKFGGILIWMAVVLWLLVVVSLLYDHGYLNVISRIPVISGLFRFLTNRRAAEAERGGAQPRGERELTDEERLGLRAEGEQMLGVLVGVDDAVAEIEDSLLNIAAGTVGEDDKGFGTRAPALVVLFSGPKGVGKSHAAEAVAKIYAGIGSLKTAKVVRVTERDAKRAIGAMALADLATERAEAARGGALLLENANWLLDDDDQAPIKPGVDFGMSLYEVLADRHQEVLVLITLSPACERRLKNDPEHARWLDKLTVRTIPFNALDDDALIEILRSRLDYEGAALDEEAGTAVRGYLREELHRFGADGVDNANAAIRVASRLVEAARRRDPEAGRRGEFTIIRDDVRAAMDER